MSFHEISGRAVIDAGVNCEHGHDGWSIEIDHGQRVISRRFSGHYTIDEVEAILRDMRTMQAAVRAGKIQPKAPQS